MLRFFFRRQDANHSLCGLFVARYILGVCRLCRLLVDGYVWICLLVRLSFARKYHLKYLVWHVGCSIPVLWTYLLHLLGTTTNKANQDGLPACHILRSGYTISIITLTLRMCPFVAPFKGVWESPDRASIQHAQTRETNTPHTYTRTPWAPTLEQKDHTPRHRHHHANHLVEPSTKCESLYYAVYSTQVYTGAWYEYFTTTGIYECMYWKLTVVSSPVAMIRGPNKKPSCSAGRWCAADYSRGTRTFDLPQTHLPLWLNFKITFQLNSKELEFLLSLSPTFFHSL